MNLKGINLGIAILFFMLSYHALTNENVILFIADGVIGILNLWVEFGMFPENWGNQK